VGAILQETLPERFYNTYYAQQSQSVDGDLLPADPANLTPRGFRLGARDLSHVAGGFRARPRDPGRPAAIDFPSKPRH
jgi:hypothetical protein